ncbi:F-type conjugative transfer protein TrbC [Candidatus Hamiltonella endosymbiont of Tuberolachnus salignus]|uniref:F-type conjugative transfer protein TrbC n=1 Tax=Candidatus Williamhamiltonella endosymbiont of Tuberolachnus salignus TaxID=3077954 RepID=UPI0030CB1880
MNKRPSSLDPHRINRPVFNPSLTDTVLSPTGVQWGFLIALVLGCLWPVTLLMGLPACVILLIIFCDRPFRMPIRLPTDIGGPDLTTEQEGFKARKGGAGLFSFITRTRHCEQAAGILCLGYARGKSLARELWLNLDDALRHIQLIATTGAGKTEAILSVYLNALCWGRGMCLSDGKAENKLAFAVWSLARRFGREDDVYVLNFLTAGNSKFSNLVNGDQSRPQSNSINLFANASETFIIQLMDSLLPKVGSNENGWQEKAKAMIAALIYALCYKREKDGLFLSQRVIQDYLPLRKIVELYQEAKENHWHEEGYKPLEHYLNTLAGFDMALIDSPSEWSKTVWEQHGFLIQQFTRMLSLFNDIYGQVFPQGAGDIDLKDVLHNDRILVVLIPALELSNSEASTLGKLYISGLRMTLSQDLCGQLEGKREDVLLSQKFAQKFPYPIIFDELGAYFASGLDKMAAQMRSLQYMLMIAAQDVQSMMDKSMREFFTVSANQRTKWFMALEDAQDTFNLIRSAAGKGYYSELSSVKRKGSLSGSRYEDADTHHIRERDNIELTELKALNKGEGVIVFQDAVVRSAAIFIPDEEKLSSKLPMRINRFIELKRPDFDALCEVVPELRHKGAAFKQEVQGILQRLKTADTQENKGTLNVRLFDKTLHHLCEITQNLDHRNDLSHTPEERGIILFEAARHSLKITEGQYRADKEPKEITLEHSTP